MPKNDPKINRVKSKHKCIPEMTNDFFGRRIEKIFERSFNEVSRNSRPFLQTYTIFKTILNENIKTDKKTI